MFPNAIQMIVQLHAEEQLRDVAKAIYGVGEHWARQRSGELDEGWCVALLRVLGRRD